MAGLSVELLAVGTELLLGQLVDTNTSFVASQLAQSGIDVFGTHGVGDNRKRIAGAMAAALERADGVITTGGLGPTVDDMTKEAVCDLLAIGTELHQPSYDAMAAFFAQLGRTMRENNRKQAEVPQGSHVLRNDVGTAPGFVALRSDGKFIACMPGVPREMKPMLVERLIPFLRERYHIGETIVTRVLHTVNIAESEIDHRIDDLFRTSENPKIAVLAHEGLCDVKIMAKARSEEEALPLIAPLQAEIEARLRGHVFGTGGQTLEGAVHSLLQSRGATLAVAESCTGGRIASALTATPGASKSFYGGVVAYDNSAKRALLGVGEATLARFGAVSEETAVAMARGARAGFGTSMALATTGIAGPDGGSDEKPVGLVWIALDDGAGVVSKRFIFPGNREAIQRRAATAALALLWRTLAEGPANAV